MPFPSPTTEDPAQRFEESKDARNALGEVVAMANQGGWGTQEITVAPLEAAKSLKAANSADRDGPIRSITASCSTRGRLRERMHSTDEDTP